MRRLLVLASVALLAAGCGGAKKNVAVSTLTTTTVVSAGSGGTTAPLELFFLAPDGKLVASKRLVRKTPRVAGVALHELSVAPPDATTDVPVGLTVTIANGNAKVVGGPLSPTALTQVVYTLTQFPTVTTVDGKSRQDVEATRIAAPILVEQPLPNDSVTSPLHVSGTADTFEATFNYELKDAGGKLLAHGFVTASSGSGNRGTFDFTVPFKVDTTQSGTLVVYESSAADGSRIHVREIPVQLSHQ
jgi:hypothetical protein